MNVITADLPEHRLFVIETETLTITAVRRGRDERGYWTKATRVYGALDALAPELMKLEPFANNYGEGYHSIPLAGPERSAEDDVRAAMWQAWSRATTKVGGKRLMELLDEAVRAGYLTGVGTKAKFSVKAGCSCPCSPGFILEGRAQADESLPERARLTPFDLHIEVKK